MNHQQSIKFSNIEDFQAMIRNLVEQGLTFEAYAPDALNMNSDWIIVLTGGY